MIRKPRTTPLPGLLVLSLVLLFAGAVVTLAQQDQLPAPRGFINDFADVIDSGTEQKMTRLIEALQQKTGAEIAVVTADSYAPYGSIEQFSVELAQEWGVGQADRDNGLVLVLTMQEREVRMEVGYGLEGIIPDGKAGAILDDAVIPSLKTGNYGEGLLGGVQAVSGLIAEEEGVDLSEYGARAPAAGRASRSGSGGAGRFVYILLFLLLAGGGRFFLFPLLFLGGGRGFFGGGFGSAGGGSGFSGFGGGGFGGGGASRGF